MSRTISVGVIGIGFGQQVHVPAFRADSRCEVRSICASSEDRARQAAQRLNIPHACGNAMSLINDPAIEVVSIAIPPAHQPPLIEAAARAGKHVFCEKPVGAAVADASHALQAVQKVGVRHAVDFLFPEIPAWQQARELIPTLGTLRHAAISWRVETYAYKTGSNSWKTRSHDGGGTLGNFVSHSAYYIEWLLGPISRLSARLSPRPMQDRGEARVDAWLELAGGLPVTLSVAADAYLGSGHRIEIYGDNGTLHLLNTTPDYVNGFELLVGGRDKPELVQRVAPQTGAGDGRVAATAKIVKRFIDAIITGGDVKPGLEEGVRVQALLDAMRNAENTGHWQTI